MMKPAMILAQPAPPSAPGGLEEVIVTAQKRSERLQKAPLDVTAVDGSALKRAQITNAQDLTRAVPSVHVNSGGAAGDSAGGNAQISIRGLGSTPGGAQGSPAVALHLDGIFLVQGLSNNQFFDIARIEVSPGPQGTLYGRSAAAGAINIITNKPTQSTDASLSVEAGNYGLFRSTGMVNVRLSDTLSLRGAFQTANHDGYFSNGFDDEDSVAGRVHVLSQPTDDLSILLSADYVHNGGLGSSPIFVGPTAEGLHLPSNPFDRSIAGYNLADGVPTPTSTSVDFRKWSVTSEIKYSFDWATFILKPGVIQTTANNFNNPVGAPYSTYDTTGLLQTEKTFEARLSDNGATKLKWVFGVNLFGNDAADNVLEDISPNYFDTTPFTPRHLHAFDNVIGSSQQSYAGFGQATYPILDWLRLTLGGRYNYDEANYTGQLGTTAVYLNGLPPKLNVLGNHPLLTPVLHANDQWRDTNYKITLDADVNPTSLVYGTIDTGTKPGGLNDGGPPDSNLPGTIGAKYPTPQVYQPEQDLHFEIGSKNRFLDDRLQINDAVYFDQYSDYQNGNTQIVNPVDIGAIGFIVTNAGRANLFGNDFTMDYQLTPHDLLSFSATYLQATFLSYTVPTHVGTSPGSIVPSAHYAGYRLPDAPNWSGTIGYQHVFNIGNGGRVTAAANMYLSSSYWSYFAEAVGTRQNGFTKTTLSVAYNNPSGLWSVQAYVKNLEDRATLTYGGTTAFTYAFLDDPRTFGAVFTIHLGRHP